MECNEIRFLLIPYSEAELEDELEKIVERHLENCPVCRKELEDLGETGRIIQSLDIHAEEQSFFEKLREKTLAMAGNAGESCKYDTGGDAAGCTLLRCLKRRFLDVSFAYGFLVASILFFLLIPFLVEKYPVPVYLNSEKKLVATFERKIEKNSASPKVLAAIEGRKGAQYVKIENNSENWSITEGDGDEFEELTEIELLDGVLELLSQENGSGVLELDEIFQENGQNG